MAYRRIAFLGLAGILSAAVVLLILMFWMDGYPVMGDAILAGWKEVAGPQHPTITEVHLQQFDFRSLVRRPPLLSAIQPGDTVRMEVESRGCFHQQRFQLEFQGGDPLSVRIIRLGDDDAPVEATEIELSSEEVSRLDGAIAFYRSFEEGAGWCTTRERISVDWTRAGISESFKDPTCLLDRGNPYALSPMDMAWPAIASHEP